MKLTSLIVPVSATTLLAFAAAACQPQSDAETKKKLDEISAKLDDLSKKVGQGGARPQPMQPPAGPDPNTVYAVPVDGSPFMGPQHAKITIVEAFEFACPFCERVRPTIDQLKKDYGNDLKVVHKQYVVHPQVATLPAQAACAAHKQGKYEKMAELLWEKGYKNNRNFAQDNIDALGKEAGLDVNKMKTDMTGECAKRVNEDQAQLASVGVRGTPAFYINGRYLSGAQPIENFKRIIDEELKKANDAIAKGTKVENYYAENVLKNGKKGI